MKTEISNSLDTARRACSRCSSHKTFRPNEEDKEIAIKSVKNAHKLLNEAFDEVRRKDETTIDQINDLKTAKRICLDAIDACKDCNKEQPKIRQIIMDIK